MKIIYQTETGIAIIHPTAEALESMTIEEIAQKDCPVADYQIVEDDAIPQERDFRNAWVLTDKIEVDITKAQAITKDRLRNERKPLLEALDVEVMKNITNADKLAQIEAEKQRLRDITKQVDGLTTVNELKAVKV